MALASAGPYASLHLAPDRQPHQHLTAQFFTGRIPFLRQTNSVKALKAMRKSTELCILLSECSWHKLSPTLASAYYSCPDNAIGLVGRQLEAVGQKSSYYYQCLCVMHSPHKLNIDSYRNTKNIKIIKIAIENANLCGKNMRYVHFAGICKKCGNMRNMQKSHIRVKLTCLRYCFVTVSVIHYSGPCSFLLRPL